MNPDILEELAPIFYPRSVAIVGVSTTEMNQGRAYLEGLSDMGFPRLYAVNPKGGTILQRKVYPSIKDIPGEVDVAILTVPREAVPEIARECAQKGVKGLTIHTSGYREKGAEGKKLEEELAAIARETGIRILGPNCMGIYNPQARMALGKGAAPNESGPLGMISQSGYMPAAFIRTAAARGMRFSKVISCGNECDLTCADFLDYLGQDPETKIITAYLEGINEGVRFFRIAREVSLRKPIIVWKGGMTDDGITAAASHTGALAISSNIWRALCDQTGIISVDSLEQMVDTVTAFYFLPRLEGRRVGIISGPGSFCVTSSDACMDAGLKLADISLATENRLAEVLPPVGTSNKNPVDVGMPGTDLPEFYYKEAIEILGKDPEVDLLLIFIGGSGFKDEAKERRVAEILLKAIRESGKPTVISSPLSLPGGYVAFLAEKGIPFYSEPRRAASALGKLAQYSDFVRSSQDWC